MRRFNKTEQEILAKLVSHPMLAEQSVLRTSVFLASHYIGPNHNISLFLQHPHVAISFPNPKDNSCKELVLVMTLFILFRDLEKEGLIACTGDSQTKEGALGEQFTEGKTVRLSTDLESTVFRFFDNILIITEDLKDLVRNGFVNEETRRHKQTMRLAWAALIISILLGLWGVTRDLLPIFFNSEDTTEATEIQPNRLRDPNQAELTTPEAAPPAS